ncbi:signal peptidase II [Shewanella violacea]|uniref:Uncharacterized protein n=1 Tax=Shewanella violacea (strain JCM 10179 / CIP 106290 / LMG 19151 / DSS12) TaxID=637905 RepID=D4ZCV2_SHEVD|nr:signal peptidase II [Shewanella violacea]BAJ03847.1 hypothetical protein SVI_3876 [Shewanella violacea DSS12]
MTYSGTAFEAGEWQVFEIILAASVATIIIFWLILTHFKRQGFMSWCLVLLVSGGMTSLCVFSRLNAMQLESLLSLGKNIEIIDGKFHYGEYRFPYMAEHGIDYREISLDERTIKLYRSGYMPNTHCYRDFYSDNKFNENVKMRLYIHWFESNYKFQKQTYKLRAPCIIKIERLNRAGNIPVTTAI